MAVHFHIDAGYEYIIRINNRIFNILTGRGPRLVAQGRSFVDNLTLRSIPADDKVPPVSAAIVANYWREV